MKWQKHWNAKQKRKREFESGWEHFRPKDILAFQPVGDVLWHFPENQGDRKCEISFIKDLRKQTCCLGQGSINLSTQKLRWHTDTVVLLRRQMFFYPLRNKTWSCMMCLSWKTNQSLQTWLLRLPLFVLMLVFSLFSWGKTHTPCVPWKWHRQGRKHSSNKLYTFSHVYVSLELKKLGKPLPKNTNTGRVFRMKENTCQILRQLFTPPWSSAEHSKETTTHTKKHTRIKHKSWPRKSFNRSLPECQHVCAGVCVCVVWGSKNVCVCVTTPVSPLPLQESEASYKVLRDPCQETNVNSLQRESRSEDT